jgi:hypothetical protein
LLIDVCLGKSPGNIPNSQKGKLSETTLALAFLIGLSRTPPRNQLNTFLLTLLLLFFFFFLSSSRFYRSDTRYFVPFTMKPRSVPLLSGWEFLEWDFVGSDDVDFISYVLFGPLLTPDDE